jgi:hypothetical protein
VPPIAGIPYEEALKILERRREELEQLPGVGSVGMGDKGIVVETDNPAVVPKEIEGLPIETRRFVVEWGDYSSHTLSERPCAAGEQTPCALASGAIPSSPSLDQCQDKDKIIAPASGKTGTQELVEPVQGEAIERVGLVQRWDPLGTPRTTDAAAAFMTSNVRPARRLEGLPPGMTFTGRTTIPSKGDAVTMVSAACHKNCQDGNPANDVHLVPLTVGDVNINITTNIASETACDGGGTRTYAGQMKTTISDLDPNICYLPGDSGAPIVNQAGDMIGMHHIVTFSGSVPPSCIRTGRATLTDAMKKRMGFDDWFGSQTLPNISFGIFRPGATANNWILDRGDGVVDTCGTGVYSDQCYTFGRAPFLPVTGKWIPGGKVKIGMYSNDPVPAGTGEWYLDFNGDGIFTDCTVDRCYAWGGPGFVPVVGDWNGGGRSKIGVFYTGGGSGAGAWYLDYNGDGVFQGCNIDRCYVFGGPGRRYSSPVECSRDDCQLRATLTLALSCASRRGSNVLKDFR